MSEFTLPEVKQVILKLADEPLVTIFNNQIELAFLTEDDSEIFFTAYEIPISLEEAQNLIAYLEEAIDEIGTKSSTD